MAGKKGLSGRKPKPQARRTTVIVSSVVLDYLAYLSTLSPGGRVNVSAALQRVVIEHMAAHPREAENASRRAAEQESEG